MLKCGSNNANNVNNEQFISDEGSSVDFTMQTI